MRRFGSKATMGVLALSVLACEAPPDPGMPSAEAVEAYYDARGLTAQVAGNVVTISVPQDAQQLRRGGALWVKVGPYVFLFSEETYQLLVDYPAVAAVRVVTRVGEADVASALLARNELSDVLWRRGMNIAGKARRDGTRRVTLLEDLVEWGEAHTEFEYNSRFMR